MVDAVGNQSFALSDAILINNLYELDAYCTSIVAQTTDGKIVHSRNLDFDFPPYLRNVTYKAKFVKDGKYAYDAVLFGGLVGVFTGMKAGAFSISEDERGEHASALGLVENVLLSFTGVNEISWTIKDTLD